MTNTSNKRIAQNTLMLYFRQILILIVSLYSVRVVLNVLGAEDYGIYSVIGGVVTLFSFLSATMASATQRFFSFALGQGDLDKLNKIFSTNVLIYLAISVIALFLLETVGLWFINNLLNVPNERFDVAKVVFHFSVLTFIFTLLSSPFMAIIIAHEDMHLYASISIIEVFLKLCVVLLLMHLPWDKLQVYSTLVFGASVIVMLLYVGVCVRKYLECQFQKIYWDKKLFREIVDFTGWTLFGQITTVGRNQAVTILLNQYFNPVVVAARAVAVNVTAQINIFSNNFNVGLYPPIIKAYAAEDKTNMFSLIFNGSRITYFLMWIFALPIFMEMDILLMLWLKNPPVGAVLFTRLALIEVLINAVSQPIVTAARAPGKMKTYELSLGLIQVILFISVWLVLLMGAPAYSVFVVAIVVNIVMFFVRLLLVKRLISLSLSMFFRKVILPVGIISFVSGGLSVLVRTSLPYGLGYSALSTGFSLFISTVCMYIWGLDKEWRVKILTLVKQKLQAKR